MKFPSITDLSASKMGFGCLSIHSVEQAVQLIGYALQKGIRYFDTAAIYGRYEGENESILGEAILILSKKLNDPHLRQKIWIATKGGIYVKNNKFHHTGNKQHIQQSIENSLKRLNTHYIDVFYLHRIDDQVSLKESISAIAEYVDCKRIRYIGLSEVTSATVIAADAIHPIQFIENEYSPWCREDEIGSDNLFKLCQEKNKVYIAYSPLGRGFFSETTQDFFINLSTHDFRRQIPRYCPPSLQFNLNQRLHLEKIAKNRNISLCVLTLAWIMQKASQFNLTIIPIPGTYKLERLQEYCQSLNFFLSISDQLNFESACQLDSFKGARIPSSLDHAAQSIGKSPQSNDLVIPKKKASFRVNQQKTECSSPLTSKFNFFKLLPASLSNQEKKNTPRIYSKL